MREIKFRVYTNRYSDDGSYEVKFGGDCVELVHLLSGDYSEEIYLDTDILVQYTGLKDKNGKEIYEGDIFHMGVVDFDRGCFNGFYCSVLPDGRLDISDSWEDGLYAYASRNEILGNIYENPELLSK